MEGPTPVSALIHAATMVTAGVFLVCRANPFFERSGTALDVVAIVGALTALIAGTVALVQPDIKRVLAYSTISQLGYMFLAVGVRAYSIAVFFVLVHAFYKATLFLGAGTVIHGTHDNQDVRTMGGLRRFMPGTALGFTIATLAIAGVPPLAGFWAKDDAISSAFFGHDYVIYLIGLSAALLTALYMTREVLLVFYGNERFHPPVDVAVAEAAGTDDAVARDRAGRSPRTTNRDLTASPTVDYGTPPAPPAPGEPHEGAASWWRRSWRSRSSRSSADCSTCPFTKLEFLNHFLEPVFAVVAPPEPTSFWSAFGLDVIAVAVATVGIFISWRIYRGGLEDPAVDPLDRRLGRARSPVRPRLLLRRGHRGRGRRPDPARRAVARRRVRPEDHRRRRQRHRRAVRRRRAPRCASSRPGWCASTRWRIAAGTVALLIWAAIRAGM